MSYRIITEKEYNLARRKNLVGSKTYTELETMQSNFTCLLNLGLLNKPVTLLPSNERENERPYIIKIDIKDYGTAYICKDLIIQDPPNNGNQSSVLSEKLFQKPKIRLRLT